MKLFFALLATLAFCSCAASQPAVTSETKLDLAVVQRLKYGETTGFELVQLLGKPDQVTPLKRFPGEAVWIYSETDGSRRFERFGVVVNQKTGIVQSATWSIQAGDSLRDRDSIFAFFKGARLLGRPVGQVAKDYISDDTVYSDPELGLFILVNGARQTAESISFEAPRKRKLASP